MLTVCKESISTIRVIIVNRYEPYLLYWAILLVHIASVKLHTGTHRILIINEAVPSSAHNKINFCGNALK